MILLNPSAGVKKETGINFSILEKLITTTLEHNHKRKLNLDIKINKSRMKGISLCHANSKKKYTIDLDTSKKNKRYLFSSILHEIRHCIQNNVFSTWSTSNMKTWRDYYFSKEEIDARKMEKLTTQFIKSYESFVKMEEQFKSLSLNKL